MNRLGNRIESRLQTSLPGGPTRREFLLRAGGGMGGLALASLLTTETSSRAAGDELPPPATVNPLAPRKPHFEPQARRMIWLFMHGGPSHVDLFDPKPDLVQYGGQPLPESFGPVMTRRKVAQNPLLAPVVPFARRGR